MTRLLAAAVTVFAISGPVLASDLPTAKGPPVYDPPPALFTWSGAYAGVNVGYGWGLATGGLLPDYPNLFGLPTAVAGGYVPSTLGVTPRGVLGGGEIGYNYQIGPAVLGVETDFQGSGIRNSNAIAFSGIGGFAPSNATASDQVNWFGTARVRAGYLPLNNVLVYGTGGLAYGNVQESTSLVGVPATSGSWSGAASATRIGWTVGAGVEWKLTNAISVKAEYLHIDLGSSTVRGLLTAGAFPGTFLDYRFHNVDDIARVGVNYSFDMMAPIVAKY